MRSAGLYVSILVMRSTHNGSTANSEESARFVTAHFGNASWNSGRPVRYGHVSSVGVPSSWKILKIWSISESPQNRTRFVASSAMTHAAEKDRGIEKERDRGR